MSCVFCDIIDKKIPSEIVYENDQIIAFNDINPKTPVHKLIVPRKHIPTINDIKAEDTSLMGLMVQTARDLAKKLGIAESGYRLVFNVNKGGGQVIFHIHLHLLGGRSLSWPPG